MWPPNGARVTRRRRPVWKASRRVPAAMLPRRTRPGRPQLSAGRRHPGAGLYVLAEADIRFAQWWFCWLNESSIARQHRRNLADLASAYAKETTG